MSTIEVVDEAAWASALERVGRFAGRDLDRVMLAMSRAAAGRLAAAMRAGAPVGATGNLRRSVGTARVRRRAGAAYVAAPLQRRGRMDASGTVRGARRGYHRHLAVRGTAPHEIGARLQAQRRGATLRQALSRVARGERHAMRLPSGEFYARVSHPGARPNPFVARAGVSARGDARRAAAAALGRALSRAGLDVGD